MAHDYRGEPGDMKWFGSLVFFVLWPAAFRCGYFKKAGLKGYKALIPIYGTYKFYDLYFDKRFFWVYLSFWAARIAIAAFFKDWEGYYFTSNTLDVLIFASSILPFATGAKRFGKGWFYSVCTFLVYPVFTAILVSGKHKYKPKNANKAKE